jgi:hypothetical protein
MEFSGDEVACHGADEQESQDQKDSGIGVAVVWSSTCGLFSWRYRRGSVGQRISYKITPGKEGESL